MKTKLSSLEGYVISHVQAGERSGSMELWGKIQGALKSAKPVKIMIVDSFTHMFDKDGNWFDDDVD